MKTAPDLREVAWRFFVSFRYEESDIGVLTNFVQNNIINSSRTNWFW